VYVVIIEYEVRVYKVAMVSTGMKVPMAVETWGAVRNVPMAVEPMEADKGRMNVPMAVETYGAVRIVSITVEAMGPNETAMEVPVTMGMKPSKATVNVLMAVQTVVRIVTMIKAVMIVSMVAVVTIISVMSGICECLVVECNNWS